MPTGGLSIRNLGCTSGPSPHCVCAACGECGGQSASDASCPSDFLAVSQLKNNSAQTLDALSSRRLGRAFGCLANLIYNIVYIVLHFIGLAKVLQVIVSTNIHKGFREMIVVNTLRWGEDAKDTDEMKRTVVERTCYRNILTFSADICFLRCNTRGSVRHTSKAYCTKFLHPLPIANQPPGVKH